MKTRLVKSLAAVVIGSLMLAGSAFATMISGGISIVGTGPFSIDTADLANATSINFANNELLVVDANGDYIGALGQTGTIQDFTFSPFAPINDFWTVAGFTFDLNDLSIFSQNSDHVSLKGTGLVHHTGYDDTPGTWKFTGNHQGQTVSWSAGAATVPEPATMLLFGTGLLGLVAVSRKKMQK